MTTRPAAAIFGAALVAAPPLLAAEDPTQGLGFSVLRAVLALIFVLALFFFLVFAIRRWYPLALEKMPGAPSGSRDQIDVRSARALGPKRVLYIVRVGTTTYFLGATDQVITKLDEWPADGAAPTAAPSVDDSSGKS